MILRIIISASLLTLPLGHVAATPITGCHELQLSQLKSLNERMNQMIDTISSLLPKSLKKLTPPNTPAPATDYIPSSAGHDTSYYSPPMYSTIPAQQQQVLYVPSYGALPTDARLPRQTNQIATPPQYVQVESAPQSFLPFSTIPPQPPQTPRIMCRYEQPLQYTSPMPANHLTPPTYPPGTYSLQSPPMIQAPPMIQSPYPPEYANPPYPFGYSLPAPAPSNIPAYMAGVPFVPVPFQIPPGAYMPTYPQVSDIQLK